MDSKLSLQVVKTKSRTAIEAVNSRFPEWKLQYDKIKNHVKEMPWVDIFSKVTNPDITMADIREFFRLVGVNLVVQKRNFVEYLNVLFKYYHNLSFAKVDFSIMLMYLFHNPFTISKRFLMKRGEKDIYTYGETPLTTLDNIAKTCQFKSCDTIFELGCGRGRSCFWLQSFVGCKVVGIEFIPDFVKRAKRIQNRLHVPNIEFRMEDMLRADFTGGTVFYLYGTCYEEPFIRKLADKFAKMPPGTKIITVSYPLTDYTDKPLFEVMKRFPVRYTWGEADVYLHVVKGVQDKQDRRN